MLFLADQDVYQLTIMKLREWGHDVVTAKDLDMHRASDKDLLNKAKKSNRLLITRDKDFGALIFLKKKLSHGVLLLRVAPRTLEKVHQQFFKLLSEHHEDELKSAFCVVEPYRYRIRHL